ncbi:hypothetical protein [Neolewinella sp.]|uniref:hypothetical protein n=1 Tax=Neolewinella sp. TaxID=2993543 RepID=UPI003B52FAC3
MNTPTMVGTSLPTRPGTGNQFILRGLHLLRAYSRNDCDTVRKLALDYLRAAEHHRDCRNYGNAIHQANTVLGLIALESDQIDQAEAYLAAAAATPGSSQLTSFGPNMLLAKKLLLIGRRKTVLRYLEQCGAFWKLSFGRLWRWKLQIRGGGTPNFGANLTHLLDPKSFG